MTDVDQIFHAIRGLPVRDRLRLVERVVHELAAVPDEAQEATVMVAPSPLGLFADDPDAVDEMMKTVTEMRRRSRLRSVVSEGEAEGSS